MTTSKHLGSCHCGAVRFAVELDLATARVARCNCTICTKIAQVGAIVKPDAFALLAGESKLATYAWRSTVAARYFCSACGIHAFGKGHLAQLGGDFVSVNVNCLDDVDVGALPVVYWDGRHDNWMAGARDTPWPTA